MELLVGMVIFMALSAAVVAMLFQNQRASEKAVADSDSGTQALMVFEKVRNELRRGRVVGNPQPEVLSYWIYQQQNQLPVPGTVHQLAFLPGPDSDPDEAQMLVEEGRLIRRFQGSDATLTRVGADGEVSFNWLSGLQMLRLSGQVGTIDPERPESTSLKRFRFQLALSNLE